MTAHRNLTPQLIPVLCALILSGGSTSLRLRATAPEPHGAQASAADTPRQALVLEADFGSYFERDGSSFAIDENTLVVEYIPEGVHVYTRTSNGWGRAQIIQNGASHLGRSLALEGPTFAAAAPDEHAVYVFDRDTSGLWVQSQKLVASDEGLSGTFGRAVAMSGNTLMVVGGANSNGTSLYIFERTAAAWIERQKLEITNCPSFQGCLQHPELALRGDTAVVGDPYAEAGGASVSGEVNIFSKSSNGQWTRTQTLHDPVRPGSSHAFGRSVSVDGQYMLIGAAAFGADVPGSVYVYSRLTNGAWALETELRDPFPGTGAGESFGYSVALRGDKALVGSPDNDIDGSRSGVAYLFQRATDGRWVEQQRLVPPNRQSPNRPLRFAARVSMSAFGAIVGETFYVGGRFYVYRGYVSSPESLVVGTAGSNFALHGGLSASFGNLGFGALPWYRYLGGEVRAAVGDVDGDGLDEVVLGLGRTSFSNGWIAVLDDAAHHHALLKWIQVKWPAYNQANGEVFPAVGDLDGDGRAEIVAGLGSGGRGYYAIFDDAQAQFDHLAWGQVPWVYYFVRDGSTHPGVGDVDGDGTAEIVLGLGRGSNGWLEVVNGAAGGYSHRAWVQIPWIAYNLADGTTFPAVGDVDGDSRGEIVVGLGAGSRGWIAVMDDASTSFAASAWLQLQWTDYITTHGETHPAVGNLDTDDAAEIAVGLAWYPSEGGWFEIFDDSAHAFAHLRWQNLGDARLREWGVQTFPAIGRLR